MTEEVKNKIERMVGEAKKILKENPNDTWVAKGLELMEKSLKEESNKKNNL
jgi:hypothetical protein